MSSLDPPDPGAADSFARLPLSAAMLENLAQLGYTRMTPIQAAGLPLVLAGHDLIAQAKTGTGKTAVFALALLARLDLRRLDVQALVLCPTRELAEQVTQEIRRLARAEDNVKVLALCGGATLRPQTASLAHGAQVVVGTPGRIVDHLERGSLRLGALKILVLDEADRMLDMGFVDAIEAVAKQCPAQRQTLLFSATDPEGMARLGQRFLRSPQQVTLSARHAASTIRQRWYEVQEDERLHAVGLLLGHYRPVRTLAFCNTRQQCRDLTSVLTAQGFQAQALHGELEQRERDQVLIQFAQRSLSVLVATDVAARGLDIEQLEAVMNVDVTPDPAVYTHRIGRTGRADAAGWAFNLASLDEMGSVGRIEQAQGVASQWHTLAELAVPGAASAAPLLPPMVTLQILGGRKDKIRPTDVLGALTGAAGLAASQVGKIKVTEFSTYVAVAREAAAQALQRLNAGTLKGKRVKVRSMQDGPTSP